MERVELKQFPTSSPLQKQHIHVVNNILQNFRRKSGKGFTHCTSGELTVPNWRWGASLCLKDRPAPLLLLLGSQPAACQTWERQEATCNGNFHSPLCYTLPPSLFSAELGFEKKKKGKEIQVSALKPKT